MNRFITLFVIAVCWQATAKSERPNIVLLLIDDWAWYGSSIPMDEGMSNSRMPIIQMPNLEQLASQGMKFRNAYSGAPQCAPSRVCIQTGQSSARSGFTLVLGKNMPEYYDTRKQYNESSSAVDLQEILDRGRDVEVQRGRVVEISRPRTIRRKRRDRRCVAMSFALSGKTRGGVAIISPFKSFELDSAKKARDYS